MDSGAQEALALYVADSSRQLDLLESQLLALERDPGERHALDAIFRAAHTIKGNATVVHQGEVEWFAHVTESVLERLRAGELLACSELVSVLLACCDHLRYLIVSASLDERSRPDFAEADRTRLIGLLVPWLGEGLELAPLPESASARPACSDAQCWRIRLKPASGVFRQGLDPLNFLRHLETLGRVQDLRVDAESIPLDGQFDAETCYLGFELWLATAADKQAIEDVFSFMREACELQIDAPSGQLEDWVGRIESLPEDELKTGEMLVRVGALTPEELASGLRIQRGEEGRPLGSILIDRGYVAPQVVEAALRRQDEIQCALQRETTQLRIPAERVDRLMNSLAGVQASLAQLAQRGTRVSAVEMVALQHALEKARLLAAGLRSARFGELFRRLHRLVRDSCLELGKRADLHVAGGEIEMDRAVADALGEALMHLLRNAIDHGLETPARRQELGKHVSGSLNLSLTRHAERLRLELRDDGGGIDLERVRALACARGLLAAESEPDEAALLAMLFDPGFSTAATLSHYSGRGVGLDAVRSALQAVGGEIAVHNSPGRGCCFVIDLPVVGADMPAAPAQHAA